MIKKVTGIFVAFICLFFIACGNYWEERGMFSEIEKEIKLEKPVVVGNIMSILEYSGWLFAGGGVVYCKYPASVRGWLTFSSAPYGKVIRLAAGYDGSTEWLYALCADYETYKLYGCNPHSGWIEIAVIGINTIFSNNAVSVGGSAGNNRAFVTTSTGIFELRGISAVAVSATDTTNGASLSSKNAAYIIGTGNTHFSDNPAFTSDGATLFAAANVPVSDITSLWACAGVLYIGTRDGPKQIDINTGILSDIVGTNADATFRGYINSAVYARQQPSGGRTDIYISAIGRGSTFASKNNGLWGYYSDRGNWNRE